MANPFLDLIKNRDNAEVAEEGNAAFGLGVDPTSIPLSPGLTNAELASEQPAVAPEIAEVVKQAVQRAPAQSIAPKNPAAEIESAPVAPKAPSIQERLTSLLEERKKAYADAEATKNKQDLLRGLAGNIGNIVGGAQAMNTKAGVTPPKTSDIIFSDPTKSVDGKYRPELDQLMAQYKALQSGNKPMTEYQQAMLGHMKNQLAQSALNSDRTHGRFYDGEERRNYQFGENLREKQELTPAQAKEVKDIDVSIDSLDKLQGMKDFSTGPIAGRVERVKRYLGQSPANKAALAAQINMVVSQYGKAISGTAVGENEFARIQQQLPNETDPDEVFAAKLANFKDSMNDSRLRVLNTYQQAGKDVTPLKDRKTIAELRNEPKGGEKAPSQSAGTVERKTPDGRIALFDSATKQFIKYKD